MGRNWCWEDIKKVIGDLQLFLKILFEAVTGNVSRWCWAFRSVCRQVGLQMTNMRVEKNRKRCAPAISKGEEFVLGSCHQKELGELQLLLWILVFGRSAESSLGADLGS